MASPMARRCRNTGLLFFFEFATPEACRYQPYAYTSNMLVFFICFPLQKPYE
jgi:hypothetical protein